MRHSPLFSQRVTMPRCLRFDLLSIAVVGLLLLAPATSQAPVTSPPGFLTTEGPGVSGLLGGFPTMRFQMVDGELRNRALAIKAIGFRWENIHGGYAPGRSFASVSLDVGFADFDRFGSTFSNNFLRPPARVFQGPMNWATGVRSGTGSPSAWRSDLRFPFRTTIVATGAEDLCLDFQFRGGVMTNGLRWDHAHNSYLLDSYDGGVFGYTYPKQHPPISQPSCVDSVHRGSSMATAQAILQCYHYGGQEPNLAHRNKLQISGWADLLAPGVKSFHLFGLGGSAAGVPFPSVACGKLHVSPTAPFVVRPDTANQHGGVIFQPFGGPSTWPTANPAFAGIPLWYQVAWEDSQTNALKLSRASASSVPSIPTPRRRATTYSHGYLNGAGRGPLINDSATSPIYRVER